LYPKTFDDETRGLERRLLSDKNFRACDIQGILRRFYEMEARLETGFYSKPSFKIPGNYAKIERKKLRMFKDNFPWQKK
jgi:hypothetical protein